MNRIATTFAAFIGLGLSACQEREHDSEPLISTYVASATVPVSSSHESIDWNREFAFVQDPAVLQKAALTLEVDPATLKERIEVEALVTQGLIRIVAAHPEESRAQELAEAYADACVSQRASIASELLDRELSQLEAQFKPQESGLERDRMTYEKAKKALAEDPE